MPSLYNCRHDGDQYRITKFDDDHNPISSYLTTADECDCPAGVRSMCRHREMLPYFIARDAVGTGWWFDYDRGGWVDMRTDAEFEPDLELATTVEGATPYESASLPNSNAANTVVARPYRKPNDGRRV